MTKLRFTAFSCAVAVAFPAVPALAGPTKKRDRDRAIKGIAETDSVFAPGSSETLMIRGMPKHLKFQVRIGPPMYRSPYCPGLPVFCFDELARHPGRNPTFFRTTGRGKASLVFTMPSGFDRMNLTSSGPEPEFVAYKEGDLVKVDAVGFQVGKKGVKNGSAATIGMIVLDPGAPPPE
jgi:hypothetical protein